MPPAATPKKAAKTKAPAPEKIPEAVPIAVPIAEPPPKAEPKPVVKEPVPEPVPVKAEAPEPEAVVPEQTPAEVQAEVPAPVTEEAPVVETPPAAPPVDEAAAAAAEPVIPETETEPEPVPEVRLLQNPYYESFQEFYLIFDVGISFFFFLKKSALTFCNVSPSWFLGRRAGFSMFLHINCLFACTIYFCVCEFVPFEQFGPFFRCSSGQNVLQLSPYGRKEVEVVEVGVGGRGNNMFHLAKRWKVGEGLWATSVGDWAELFHHLYQNCLLQ